MHINHGFSDFLLDIESLESHYAESGLEFDYSTYAIIADNGDNPNEQEQAVRDLWSEVLHQAIDDLDDPDEKNKAAIWFNSKNININSFICICHTLDLDPDAERKRILNNSKHQ